MILKGIKHTNITLLHTLTPKMTTDICIVMNSVLNWLFKTWLGDWLKVTKMAELIPLATMGFVNTCSDQYILWWTFLFNNLSGKNMLVY